MAFNFETKKYVDKDKKRLFLYLFDHDIELSDDTYKTSVCEVCDRPLPHFKNISCIICKRPSCKLCAAKYWIPGEKISKEKDTLQYVCLICRDQLLVYKQEHTGISANLRPYRNFQISSSGKVSFLPPLLWAPKKTKGRCFECGRPYKSNSSVHNCRICGELVDNRCTLKIDLPRGFERKLQKESQKSRVCLDCRFYVVSGIELKPSDPIKFSGYDINKEWETRTQLQSKIPQNTLFPSEISLTFKNTRKYPELPEYNIQGLVTNFKSPEIKVDKKITNLLVNGERNQKIVIVARIELNHEMENEESENVENNEDKNKNIGNFGTVDVNENDENDSFANLIKALSRKSNALKLKKIKHVGKGTRKKVESELDKAIKERFEALGDEFVVDNESGEENWDK